MIGPVFPEHQTAGRQVLERRLRCEASPGQFPGELAITGSMFNGTVFSLFMPETRVECNGTPSEGHPVEAWLPVEVIDQRDDLFVVLLPRQTLENGQFVAVRAEQLRGASQQET